VRPYRDVGCRIFNAGGVIDPAPPEVWIKNKKSLRSRRLSGKTPGGPWVIFFYRRGAEDAEGARERESPRVSGQPSPRDAVDRMGGGRFEGAKVKVEKEVVDGEEAGGRFRL
jgi:hypothetical protein